MKVTLSGPDVERTVASAGAGVSAALTLANRATRQGLAASYYVRDEQGELVGRADSDGAGGAVAFGAAALRLYRDRGELPPETSVEPDRASARTIPQVRADGRPGIPSATAQEEKMATRKSSGAKPAAKKKPTARKPAAKKPAQARRTPPPASVEKGTDLLATLMHLVESRVEGVERKPNPSQTYTLLRTDGKTFAYVFPPRKSGVLVKIPRQLLGVEDDLPEGHGFKRGEYGLTRTMKAAADAPSIVAALQQAAKQATTKATSDAVEPSEAEAATGAATA